ncbi:hypothetical protein S40288_07751 [Stachybotrys chartarum IBT 40288]|nr:hypothetical protein S40288_07751 [Stachybotrys chartarum IBT 40288]
MTTPHPDQPSQSFPERCQELMLDSMPTYRPLPSSGSSQQPVWPSPSMAPCDCRICHDQKSTVDCGCLNCKRSNSAPGAWSSPAPGFLLTPEQHPSPSSQQESLHTTDGSSPVSAPELYYSHALLSTESSHNIHSVWNEDQAYPSYTVYHSDQQSPYSSVGVSPYSDSPNSYDSGVTFVSMLPKTEPMTDQSIASGLPDMSSVPRREGSESIADGKLEGPYANLIYQALMTRPDHSMTLQEIYQWFRDNTNKARKSFKGWQNSIRHNLSMNKAFTNRDPTGPEGSKRSAEWVLEDWAVRTGGVQSTTRYRKCNPPRRTVGRRGAVQSSASRLRQRPNDHGELYGWNPEPSSMLLPRTQAPLTPIMPSTRAYPAHPQTTSGVYPSDHFGNIKHDYDSMPPTPGTGTAADPLQVMMPHAGSALSCGDGYGDMLLHPNCGGDPSQTVHDLIHSAFPYSLDEVQVPYSATYHDVSYGDAQSYLTSQNVMSWEDN